MSPQWHREDQAALIEARRVQRELAAAAETLTLVAGRLADLVAELDADRTKGDDDD